MLDYATSVTVRGTFEAADGSPERGYLLLYPRFEATDETPSIVGVTGAQVRAVLDSTGSFSVAIRASDDEGWAIAPDGSVVPYTVEKHFSAGKSCSDYVFFFSEDPIDINAQTPWAVGDEVVMIPVEGPPGPTAVSSNAGNTAVLGTDGLIYVPTAGMSGVLERLASLESALDLLRSELHGASGSDRNRLLSD